MLTKIDRLNVVTQTTMCATIRELLQQIEVWEQLWAKYGRL